MTDHQEAYTQSELSREEFCRRKFSVFQQRTKIGLQSRNWLMTIGKKGKKNHQYGYILGAGDFKLKESEKDLQIMIMPN